MKIKLRLIAGITAGLITFVSLGVHLFAADTQYQISTEDSRFKYTYVSESEKTISVSANGDLSGNINIPSTLDGNTVAEISSYGFSEQPGLTGITIPQSVTKIGSFAFNSCTSLKDVSIPDSIINMGIRPFVMTAYETNLEKKSSSDFVIINDYILYKYRGNDADIVIPDGVRVISNSVFAYDENSDNFITSVVFPDSVQYICEFAFLDCNHISKVTLGNGITNIKLNSFTVSSMTVYGYMYSYAATFASDNGYTFSPILNYGETRTEVIYTDKLRQYYFSDEDSFSSEGIKVGTRNYNGTFTEIPWTFSSTPGELYK
ncbi:MAG: leucine-rich repeat domain-containing protein [Porcipelethomonas sp.]